jgi:hypothetical protein
VVETRFEAWCGETCAKNNEQWSRSNYGVLVTEAKWVRRSGRDPRIVVGSVEARGVERRALRWLLIHGAATGWCCARCDGAGCANRSRVVGGGGVKTFGARNVVEK